MDETINCYNSCYYYSYYNSSNNKSYCTNNSSCQKDFKKLTSIKKQCIENCTKDSN